MNEANPIVFEVIVLDGAIEKRDPDELITNDEMSGIMLGVEPKGRRES